MWKMNSKAVVSSILVLLFVVSVFPMSTFSEAADSQGSLELLGPQSTVDWWPTFHHDLMHTGYSTSTAPTTNVTSADYGTGSWVASSPTVVDGVVYIGSGDNNVYALHATTGTLVWNYMTYGPVFSSPAVAEGRVYVGSLDCRVYAIGKQVDVYRSYRAEPAPMGIADYGIGPSGPYECTTKSFVGIVTIGSLLMDDGTAGFNYNALSFQLNVEFEFNTTCGPRVF